MSQIIFSKIEKIFNQAEKILLISHRQPDGDACGSIISFLIYGRELGKKMEVFLIDPPPSYFSFLPYYYELKSDNSVLREKWDVVVVLDTGDWPHTGLTFSDWQLLSRDAAVINIDHHWTNKHFGQLNLVNVGASSTCEIIYYFFRAVYFPINRQLATALLNGILSDTGGLMNSATTAQAIKATAELTNYGGRINKITNYINKNKSINGLRLWGLILSRLQINRKFNLAFTYIRDDDFKRYQVDEEELDGLVNFLNVIAGVKIALIFRLNHGKIKASLRTTRDDVDVAQLASIFGGGGHKKAAGFIVPWEIVIENERLKLI